MARARGARPLSAARAHGDRRRADRRPVVIGLTGPIGCGKSTIARWLRELGAVVVDADVVAREVVEPGEPALAAIVERFGRAVVRADGRLDRPALGRIVFSDAAALADLEAIVHPAVRPGIAAAVEAARAERVPAVVVEAIKLVEAGYAAECDEVWLVTCAAGVQRERLLGRGMAPADVEQRIDAQDDLAARLAPAATTVIDSSGAPEATRRRVEAAWRAALGGRPGQPPAEADGAGDADADGDGATDGSGDGRTVGPLPDG